MNIKSDGNKPDSPKGLSRLSQKFAMSKMMRMMMMMMMMRRMTLDDRMMIAFS